jgi:hypothetical protein
MTAVLISDSAALLRSTDQNAENKALNTPGFWSGLVLLWFSQQDLNLW